MANKRIVDLTPITAAQMATGDLFILNDISAIETKRLTTSELTKYIQSAITASLTSSYANKSATSSFLIYNGNFNGSASNALTASLSTTSSNAILATNAISASYSTTASYSITSSNSITASYALVSFTQTVVSSSYSNNAVSASYLTYNSGGLPNGTASYAITSATSSFASTSNTSSYITYSGIPNGTSSYALVSKNSNSASILIWNGPGTNNGTSSWSWNTVLASQASTASFLTYDGTNYNGSASYALTSGTASYVATSSRAITASYALRSNVDDTAFKIYGPYVVVPAGSPVATASIALGLTGSFLTGVNVVIQFEGDIETSFTGSVTGNWDMIASPVTGAFTTTQMLGDYTSPGTSKHGITLNAGISGSIRRDFVLRGQTNLTAQAYNIKLYAGSGTIFKTDTRALLYWVYSKFDSINILT